MATLKHIRRRIASVGNTQKITRAMKMVSAAKLRRARERAESFRAYADLCGAILADVAADLEGTEHPLLRRRAGTEHPLLLVIGADRGLCGGFNGNLNRFVLARLRDAAGRGEAEPTLDIIGRKQQDFFSRRDVTVRKDHTGVHDPPDYDIIAGIARELAAGYESAEFDRIDLAFSEMVSMVSQKPVLRPLLPVTPPSRPEMRDGERDARTGDFIFEPGRRELLDRLLPLYVEVQLYRALLESNAAEHAARMTAMENATNNATEMIEHLTLVRNRARQGAITGELMDIIGGAEALGG